ncbi:MAG: GNAT family N-acetyltransferase [Chloroflexi bacterium]|nr:GNAT family N-acetyltransferase [Chloroflexota bacterium]
MNADAVVIGDSFTVCDASLFDLPAVWRLERVCFPKDAYDVFTLLSLALTPNVMRLKAVADNQLVGYLAGEVRRGERVGWIVTIGVAPRYRGHGIGRALLASAERALRRRVSLMRLTVRRSNTHAIALYDRCGYLWVSTIRGYYHDGEDGLIMEKNLTLP